MVAMRGMNGCTVWSQGTQELVRMDATLAIGIPPSQTLHPFATLYCFYIYPSPFPPCGISSFPKSPNKSWEREREIENSAWEGEWVKRKTVKTEWSNHTGGGQTFRWGSPARQLVRSLERTPLVLWLFSSSFLSDWLRRVRLRRVRTEGLWLTGSWS